MLNNKQLNDIRALQDICEQDNGIKLKLNWDMLEQRSNLEDDYFYYANDNLIGYLALYGFGDSYELCGMVHPESRGKGIFHGLFSKALASLKERNAHSLLINVPGTSDSGKTFTSSIKAVYDFTEYEMKWEPNSQLPLSENVRTRKMLEDDIPYCIKLDIECFGQSRSDAESMLIECIKEKNQRSLMIEVDGNTVGKIRMQRMQNQSFIYGFAVDTQLQGKGIGRKALSYTVREESKWTQDIFLDVAATNSKALKLYEKSGFKTIYSQDYYQFKI
ncbi:GNAT family N-acetyltransferase [Rossellomorea oryzaecorticis]|uniref:GNAT family N-acetyltransferase n=1 Tax=Rossellomorea oryzaecorticis TaxID=1396505 RepID=A0ABU9KGS9_9BACI